MSLNKLPLTWRFLAMNMALDGIFYVPIAIAYYQLKGADLGGFLFLQGFFRVAMLIFEVPTGLLSDRWSRHHQLLVGSLVWLLQLTVLFLSTGYNGLLIAEVLAALSFCLRSGTTESYLHEFIVKTGKPKEASIWQSRLFAGSLFMEMTAYLSGGWLYGQWVEAPVLATFALATIGVWLSIGLPKISRARVKKHENSFRDIYLVLRWSLREHPKVPWLLLGPPILFGCSALIFWIVQERLVNLGVSPIWLGIYFAGACLIKVGMAMMTDHLIKYWNKQILILFLPLCLIIGMLLVAFGTTPVMVWLGGVIGAGAVHAVGRPFTVCMVNNEITDNDRATVLSIVTLINTLVGALLLISSTFLLLYLELSQVLMLYLGLTLVAASYPLYRLIHIYKAEKIGSDYVRE